MVKVITYGTFDLLHHGHIRLLERAKALGDYLIVGITSDDFDRIRGKINAQQSLEERVAAVKATGLPDQIIIEEYEGQKIEDIKKYNVDIFTVGSDWKGHFDYLKKYCQVVYLDRTKGISSSELRAKKVALRLGIVGQTAYVNKFIYESSFVNGIEVTSVCTDMQNELSSDVIKNYNITHNYDDFLNKVDCVYIHSYPLVHYQEVKKALLNKKHVLCESPIALNKKQCDELFSLAKKNKVVLMEALRTAYSVAFSRMLLLIKSGKIGHVTSVDATCTSLRFKDSIDLNKSWNSITAWGPTGMLPVFDILGTDFKSQIATHIIDENSKFDTFSKISFLYNNAVASVKVGTGVKSEGELIVSGTDGYVYVPAPWWKTDYFEIRYENPVDNKRYFYQLDGEGIRYELLSFVRKIQNIGSIPMIDKSVTSAICGVISDFYEDKNIARI